MGNQQSRSTAIQDVVNKSITDVLLTSSSTCSQSNSAVQKIEISGVDTGPYCRLNITDINQTSVMTPNFTCSSNNTNNTSLMTDFQNKLDNNAKSAVSGLSLNLNSESNATAITTLKNEIKNNISVSNVSSCVQNNFSDQSFISRGARSGCPAYCGNINGCPAGNTCDLNLCSVNFGNINQTLVSSAVGNCLSSNSNLTSAINTAANTLQTSADSSNSGVLGGFGGIMAIIIVVIIVMIMAGFFLLK